MPTDHPDTLIKYCTSETAEKILSSQTLRWSAPHLFSDPFEPHHETKLNFDPHVLLQASIKMATAMIFAKDPPRGKTPLVAAIRRWREEERFASPDEAEDVLKELLSQIVDQRQAALDQVMTDWRKFTRNLRICCFCARPDNLAAWQRHGEQHRGIAIRFQCGEYSSLVTPKQVNYKGIRPEITSLKEQIGIIMNNDRFVAQEHFYEKFITKPPIDSPIQEWRCFRKPEQNLNIDNASEQTWFNDVKFERSEATAVYFGIYTDPKIKRKIHDIVKEQFSQAKVFQAKSVTGKYEIELERLTARNRK